MRPKKMPKRMMVDNKKNLINHNSSSFYLFLEIPGEEQFDDET
jgi:hypothetical protein